MQMIFVKYVQLVSQFFENRQNGKADWLNTQKDGKEIIQSDEKGGTIF